MINRDYFKKWQAELCGNAEQMQEQLCQIREKGYGFDRELIREQGELGIKSRKCVVTRNGTDFSCLFIKGSSNSLHVRSCFHKVGFLHRLMHERAT